MATRLRSIKTGREELEWLREQRDRMRTTMRTLRAIDQEAGGMPKVFGEDTPEGAVKNKPSDYSGSFESEYYKTYKTLHAKMGEYIGSSMNPRGRVGDVISPSIARNQQTGERVKPFADIATTGPEYEYEQKYMRPPKDAAYSSGLKFNRVNAPLSRAQSFGSELAVMRRESSALVARSVGAIAERLAAQGGIKPSQLANFQSAFVKKLQYEIPMQNSQTGEVTKGLGNLGILPADMRRIGGDVYETKPRASTNTAVNPSGPAKPTRRPLTKSPLEPRTAVGSQGIPEVFKKAWGTPPKSLGGLGIGGVVPFSGPDRADFYSSSPDQSDMDLFHRTVGTSRATFQARTILDFIKSPENTPEQKYEIWKRFGPKKGFR